MSVTLRSPGPQHDFGKGPHWLHESPFLPFLWEQSQANGAPSLKHAAMKQILRDQSALNKELFQQVPWYLALYLWKCLGRCGKRTLHMWKIMAQIYPTQFQELSPLYRLDVESPKEPLKLYIDIMNSDPSNWGAVLSLPSTCATIMDLVAIGSMKSLVALDIYPSSSADKLPQDLEQGRGLGLDDRIIRSWVETAESMQSLQQLRVLRFYAQDQLTTQALWMLEKLPCLEVVVAYSCKPLNHGLSEWFRRDEYEIRFGNWIARRLTWDPFDEQPDTVTARPRQTLLEVYRDLSSAKSRQAVSASDSEQSDHKRGSSGQQSSKSGSSAPIMEIQLSSPVKWPTETGGNIIITFTRAPDVKKRPPSVIAPKNKRKRVMKNRGGRDMAELLGEFL